MQAKYCNLNGRIVACNKATINVSNGTFRYGYGVFETMLLKDGFIRFFQQHMDRLLEGVSTLFGVAKDINRDTLASQIMETAACNGLESLCRVRLQVFAADGGIFEIHTGKPGYIIECFPLPVETMSLNENGLVTGIATLALKSKDALANLKTTNALVYALAARQAKENKWNDALVLNTSGNIIETAIGNIFWFDKAGELFTPPLSEGCVAGVMRRHIVETLNQVIERPLTPALLAEADEVFVTNAIKPVKWIKLVGEQQFTGNKTKAFYTLLSASIL